MQAQVLAVDISGPINPVASEIISSAIDRAANSHDVALIIRLNTPGGLLDSTRDIVHSVLTARIPVIVWVAPAGVRAASAGFFILESAQFAAMAPGTNTGASHPVSSTGQDIGGVMAQKVENDTAAFLRSIAVQRGRNAVTAEKAVRESVSWTEREALDAGLIDAIAPDTGALLSATGPKLHLAGQAVEWYTPPLRLQVLGAISNPDLALILFVIGAFCIYVEFTVPGAIAPGVCGAVLILLSLTAFSMFPIHWLGAALIMLALVFFILEARFTSHGALTVGGALCMIFGAINLIDSGSDLRIHLATAIATAVPFALISAFLFSLAAKARRNKVVTGPEAMLLQTGVAIADLNPSGLVTIRGEYWNARADVPVARDTKVRVTGIEGLTLRVEPEKEQDSIE